MGIASESLFKTHLGAQKFKFKRDKKNGAQQFVSLRVCVHDDDDDRNSEESPWDGVQPDLQERSSNIH